MPNIEDAVIRAHPGWRDHVRETGDWWQPTLWSRSGRIRVPAYTDDEIVAAANMVTELYSAKETRNIFSTDKSRAIQQIMVDNPLLEQSELLALGMDLAAAPHAITKANLRRDLCLDKSYRGARFEVRTWAALERRGIHPIYEPCKQPKGRNPDFEIPVGSDRFIVDTKARPPGEALKALETWYRDLMTGAEFVNAHVEVHFGIADLDADDRDRLAILIRMTAREVAGTSNSISIGATVPGIDQNVVTVSGTNGSMIAPRFDLADEAERVTRGLVQAGAHQISSCIENTSQQGIVLVELGRIEHTDPRAQILEIGRWMKSENEGGLYPPIAHVIVVYDGSHAGHGCLKVSIVSREATPPHVLDLIDELTRGYNELAWRNAGLSLDALPLVDRTNGNVGVSDPAWPSSLPASAAKIETAYAKKHSQHGPISFALTFATMEDSVAVKE